MIDYKTYRQMHPTAHPFWFGSSSKLPFDKWPEVIPHPTQLEKDNLLVLPSEIHGFSFKKKDWSKFAKRFQTMIHAAQ
jgi:hypothetical protein